VADDGGIAYGVASASRDRRMIANRCLFDIGCISLFAHVRAGLKIEADIN